MQFFVKILQIIGTKGVQDATHCQKCRKISENFGQRDRESGTETFLIRRAASAPGFCFIFTPLHARHTCFYGNPQEEIS